MKKGILTLAIMLIGTLALAGPSPCEAGANAAYDAVIKNHGTTTQAQAAYDASLAACEKKLKEDGWD